MRSLIALSLASLALVVAACGDDDSSSSATSTPAAAAKAPACDKAGLALKTPGTLTVGTDKPAYPPYFEDDDPTNGKGFESAVAYAVAERLGFTHDEVKWKVLPFNSSYAPGEKKFDFDINQISTSPQRAKHVDFSRAYFTAPQAFVALKGSPAAGATSLADLKTAKLGVQVGTTSLDAVNDSIQPSTQPQVFNDSNDTVRALRTKRAAAIVTDLPTAFYITAAQVPDSKIVGQFGAPGGDRWGLLLPKGSQLTRCVNAALAKVAAAGELKRLQDRWMGGDTAPELH